MTPAERIARSTLRALVHQLGLDEVLRLARLEAGEQPEEPRPLARPTDEDREEVARRLRGVRSRSR